MCVFQLGSTHPESDFIETDMSSESGPDAPPSYHVAVASQEGEHYLDEGFDISDDAHSQEQRAGVE